MSQDRIVTIARLVAGLLRRNEVVNLGIGLPSQVPGQVDPSLGVVFHAEHGVMGFGGIIDPDEEAAGTPAVTIFGHDRHRLFPGASVTDHAASFALIRSGRVHTSILGAFEVDARGEIANWRLPKMAVGGVGGAPEIAAGVQRVIVAMEHCTGQGRPRLVQRTELPLGLARTAAAVVTELGVFRPTGQGFTALQLAPGIDRERVLRDTAAPVTFD